MMNVAHNDDFNRLNQISMCRFKKNRAITKGACRGAGIALFLKERACVVTIFCLLCLTLPAPSTAGALTVLDETFSNCSLPSDWLVTPDPVNGCQWLFDGDSLENITGGEGCYAMADSDFCADAMDTTLTTPVIDCSQLKGGSLSFKFDLANFSASTFQVDISNDNGASWSVVWNKTETDTGDAILDVSGLVDGKANVLIQFHYITPASEYYWQIDDIELSGERSFPWLLFMPAILAN